MNPISLRLLSQQLCSPQFSSPSDVVGWFGAMQAQDCRSMRWAVAMRTKVPSFSAFERAFNEGSILRAHLLRCTWQLVGREDYHWIREVIYRKSLSVMKGWLSSSGLEIPSADKDRALCVIEDFLGERGVATEEEISLALREKGISTENHLGGHHLRMAELEGLVCSGPLGPRNTYMLTRDRVGAPLRVDHGEALSRLAGKYFQGHGPSTLEDFVWWSGLNIGECRKGIAGCGSALWEERYRGRVFYIHEKCRSRGFRGGNLLLLPSYDEYLIGYKSRDVVLHPSHAPYAHDKKGIFHHVVALDGEIVGNWHPSTPGKVSLFKEGVVLSEEAVGKAFDRLLEARGR